MRNILVKRIPPVAIANISALFRILGLIAGTIIDKCYPRLCYGPEANIPGEPSFSAAHWAAQYLVPVVVAWIIGLLFAIGYNAIVKSIGSGLRIEIDE